MMRILSLGFGVQSTTMAFMVALGELEPVDFAIHADTTHEYSGTYEFAKRWTPWLEERGVKVVTVVNPDTKVLSSGRGGIHIPAYTSGGGKTHRQCTGRWKIDPMRRWEQIHRNGKKIEQWIGISLDEFMRMRDSDVKYITHRWPLIEKRMTRNDCIVWLKAHNLEVPPRSACTFCPFHNTREWQHIKASPMDWEEAIKVDNEIRRAYLPQEMFLHRSLKPLEDVDLRTEEERGQIMFDGWDSECSGICGV